MKSSQKLAVITEFIIPKVCHFAQGPPTLASLFRTVDSINKAAVKATLHLQLNTPDPSLYASMKDGVIGLMVMYLIARNTIRKLMVRTDEITLISALQTPATAGLEKLCVSTSAAVPWRSKLINFGGQNQQELDQYPPERIV